MTNIKEALKNEKIPYIENQPMAQKTTFKVGSTADLFVAPENAASFIKTLNLIKENNLPYFILGGGSNVVFPDTPYKKIIVSTENLKKIEILDSDMQDKVFLKCQAGTPMASFVSFCSSHNFSGAEQFAGLPGSVGGAVYMNARCFNKSISELFYSAEYINTSDECNNSLNNITFSESDWSYKRSPFQEKDKTKSDYKVVTSATFILKKLPENDDEAHKKLEEDCKHYISERVSKGHFKYPSAGSVFKNNRSFGKPSGQIIDEAGLRGLQIGGAQIAPFHGNFIINTNNATSEDIKKLVLKAKETVFNKYGFNLETEIIFL